MKRIKANDKASVENAIDEAVAVLKGGGVVIYPTDTLYGIGVDATDTSAIEKVFALKGRDVEKALSVIVGDKGDIKDYAEVSTLAEKVIARMMPGPVTLLLPKKDTLPNEITRDSDSLGVRVPDSYISISLAQRLGRPMTTTSANKSGMKAHTLDEILDQLKGNEELIDLVIDTGEPASKKPSSIFEIEGESVKVIREGEVNFYALLHLQESM